jgi:hypothetical protein
MFFVFALLALILSTAFAMFITVPLAVLKFHVVKANRYAATRMPPFLRTVRDGRSL